VPWLLLLLHAIYL